MINETCQKFNNKFDQTLIRSTWITILITIWFMGKLLLWLIEDKS